MKTRISLSFLFCAFVSLRLCFVNVAHDCSITIVSSSEDNFAAFNILNDLKNGNFGKVFKVTSKDYPHCKYAIKEIPFLKDIDEISSCGYIWKKNLQHESEVTYSTEKEVENEKLIMKTLSSNPHFLKYYGSFEEDKESTSNCYMIMEFVEGSCLEDLIEASGLSTNEIQMVAAKIAILIEEMHSMNIVHGDIKPSNIIYDRKTGKLNLVDFGLSTQLSSISDLIFIMKGTLGYVNRDIHLQQPYDYTTDWYAYGITLLRLFGGHVEYHGKTQNGITVKETSHFFINFTESKIELVKFCLMTSDIKEMSLFHLEKLSFFESLDWDAIKFEFASGCNIPLSINSRLIQA